MDNSVAVSIVCNVYNHENYIRQTLDSFVSQKTTFPFEILVHDDASTDRSADIIREYEAKYPELIKPMYQTENQHSRKVPITATFQIPRVKGRYVAYCEGDDYWTDPLKLQKQFDFLEAHPDYSLCVCSTIWLDMRTGKEKNLCRTDTDRDVSLEEIILETKGRPFQLATFFIRAEYFCSRPDWMIFGVLDAPLAMNAAIHGKVRMLAEPMAVYRNNAPGSWTAQISTNKDRKVKAFEKVIDGLNAFNMATEYTYNDVVSLRIKRLKYFIARANRDWKALRSGELREVYLARRPMARISDMLSCIAPKLKAFLYRKLQ